MKTPRAKIYKKSISVHKFERVAKDPQSKRVKVLHLPKAAKGFTTQCPTTAIEAYVKDNFVYVWRKCNSRRLKTDFFRYNMLLPKTTKEICYVGG